MVIGSIIILGLIAFLVYSNIKNVNKQKSDIALLLKILVNDCQTMMLLASIDLKWPISILYLFNFSTMVGDSTSQVLTISCSEISSGYSESLSELSATMMLPFMLILIALIV